MYLTGSTKELIPFSRQVSLIQTRSFSKHYILLLVTKVKFGVQKLILMLGFQLISDKWEEKKEETAARKCAYHRKRVGLPRIPGSQVWTRPLTLALLRAALMVALTKHLLGLDQ